MRRGIVAVVIGLALGCRAEPAPGPPPIRLSLPVPDNVEPGSLDAAIAPDESAIVFAATSDGRTQLWRRAFADGRAEPLRGSDGAELPAWKPTGNVVSFFAGGRLKQIAVRDGAVADLAAAPSPAGAAWLGDGSLLFAPDESGPIRRLLNGRLTDATVLADGDRGHVHPSARGNAGDFVYVAIRADGRRVVRLVTAGTVHDLTTTSGHAVLVGDVLLHVQDGVLLAYRFDPDTIRLPGRGIPVALDAGVSERGRGLFAASPRMLLHARPAPRSREVVWLDASGAPAGAIADTGDHWQVRLSPDDRYAAVTTLDPLLRTLDVFVSPTAGVGTTERLTLSLSADTAPVWSPDGARVLFRSLHEGVPTLFARRAHTKGAADEVMLESPLDETPTDWSRTGQILFHARGATSQDVFVLTTGEGTYTAAANTPFNETEARWSANARWMAYVSDESGQPDVYVQDERGARQRVSFGGGTRPRWSRDGRTLFFVRGEELLRATLDPRSNQFGSAQTAFGVPGIVDFDTAHRSDRVLVVRDTGSRTRAPLNVVLDWPSLVSQEQGGGE